MVISQPTIPPGATGFQDKGLGEEEGEMLLVLLLLVACEGQTETLHAHGPGFGRQLEVLQPFVMTLVTIANRLRRGRRQKRVKMTFQLLQESKEHVRRWRSCHCWGG